MHEPVGGVDDLLRLRAAGTHDPGRMVFQRPQPLDPTVDEFDFHAASAGADAAQADDLADRLLVSLYGGTPARHQHVYLLARSAGPGDEVLILRPSEIKYEAL